ncbi:RraA family protein [Alicyclobacillus tolerans]|uniref:RraA family protein n=1 Tax=Alicyclobacillus tolerans TaxID=90970 RepID=UPI001F27E908|nr:RraA family protein [Alicyclobacillus tolerans]MCF8563167.1 RraA family protein [Alicyclobacillus tolerans]
MSEEIIEQLKGISIAAVSDAMDRLGISGTCLGIQPLRYGFTMVGRSYTVRYLPLGQTQGTVGDYIDEIPEGSVVVLDNAGRTDCTVWGDILTAVAHQKGLAGTVIDGVCRDVRHSLDLNYPIFSRGQFMRTGKNRVEMVATCVPVNIAGVPVRTGDIVYGSDDGVLVIPQEVEREVANIAQEIEQSEEAIRKEVMTGISLRDARKKHGYHTLQSPKL